MAITKQKKQELLDQYKDWLLNSQAVVITEYTGLTMKELDELRRKLREIGGEFHIVKNTISKLALKEAGFGSIDDVFEGSTAMGFGFEDAPGLAKAMADFAKESEFIKIKAGYLGNEPISPDRVKALADLPPLPVMRATLLGTLLAPASQLVRVLAEPGRQVAAVLQAHVDANANPAPADA